MEEKLEEFKRRRRKEILLNKSTGLLRGILKNTGTMIPSATSEANTPLIVNSTSNSEVVSDSEVSSILSDNSTTDLSVSCPSWLTLSIYGSYFLLWLVTFCIAIHFEFGYVYLVVSGLLFIYFNTRTRPKKKGEMSAYSVFNPNCEAIDGTLKAEQFEREFNLIKHEVSTPSK